MQQNSSGGRSVVPRVALLISTTLRYPYPSPRSYPSPYLTPYFDWQAYEALEELHVRLPKTNLSYFVPTQTIQMVHSALNVSLIESPILQSLKVNDNASRVQDDSDHEEQIQEEDGVNDFFNWFTVAGWRFPRR